MVSIQHQQAKTQVKEHWETESCGTRYGADEDRQQYFEEISAARYRLEPYIQPFADFKSAHGLNVLEIGVGAGSDFQHWVDHAAHATGVDLTERAIDLTCERLQLSSTPHQRYTLRTADVEQLPFADESFDLVYSWGVLHHSPDTVRAFGEAFRVLKPGGTLRAMIYHDPSWTGLMLYLRYGVLFRQFRKSPREIIFKYLESPGTKVYTSEEASRFLTQIGFVDLKLSTKLGPGDLLTIRPSRKYDSYLFKVVRMVYPRWLVRLMGDRYGLNLLVSALKPGATSSQKAATPH